MNADKLSQLSRRTPESPISYFMQQAVENKNIISLAAGMVDTASLPEEVVQAAVERVLADPKRGKMALQYGTTQGLQPLRQKVVHHLQEQDGLSQVPFTAEQVVITTGSQQLLYILSELLLDPGDIVITEAPSYFVYHSVLTARGVEVLTIPMDAEGLIVSELEKLYQQLQSSGNWQRVKLLYTVDYYQNPSGRTLSAKRRQEMIQWLQKLPENQRPCILEDAAYRELRFDGESIPSLKGMEGDLSCVVYAGTFSKPCAPGFKTGYAVLPKDLVAPFLLIKGNHDFGSANLNQYILDELLQSGEYARQVEKLKPIYKAKRDAMVNALQDHFGGNPGFSWTEPAGGMFIWLKGPLSSNPDSQLAKEAIAQGVLYVPGCFAYAGPMNDRPNKEMRLAFGDASPQQIREGVARLAKAYEKVAQPVKESTIRPDIHTRPTLPPSVSAVS